MRQYRKDCFVSNRHVTLLIHSGPDDNDDILKVMSSQSRSQTTFPVEAYRSTVRHRPSVSCLQLKDKQSTFISLKLLAAKLRRSISTVQISKQRALQAYKQYRLILFLKCLTVKGRD